MLWPNNMLNPTLCKCANLINLLLHCLCNLHMAKFSGKK